MTCAKALSLLSFAISMIVIAKYCWLYDWLERNPIAANVLSVISLIVILWFWREN